ncbi:MAG: glycoside hydrolase family 3 protein [Longibaculum sp.]
MLKKYNLQILCLIFCLILLCACQSNESDKSVSQNSTPQQSLDEKEPQNQEKPLSQAQQILNDMSLKEKIGQLFIIRPESLDSSLTPIQVHDPHQYGVTKINKNMQETFNQYPAGGIIMFSKNIINPSQITTFTKQLQSASQIPLFMAIDEEGGLVSRIATNSSFQVKTYKNMTEIGKTKNPKKAQEVGKTIGTYLNQYGFNLDFAPDADINTNPKNPIIGTRSFGTTPKLVSQMVSGAIEGFHSVDMMTSIKHFPGHGDTQTDTHLGYVGTNKTWDELLKCELIPFIDNKDKTDMIMVSHITVKNVTDDHLPSSLSYEMITKRLRQELGYEGIVITDSLAMGAVTNDYSPDKASLMAFQAGADILLMPEDYKVAFDSIYDAVQNQKISEDRINESVLKIIHLKLKYHLI